MKESVKKSLNKFIESITPEELDAILEGLNKEYDSLCGSDTLNSFDPSECVFAYSDCSFSVNGLNADFSISYNVQYNKAA